MTTDFSLELRSVRKKSGLTQDDVALLLGCKPSTIGALESGRRQPRIDQLVMLSLIFGRSFECFYADVMHEARERLAKRLPRLPGRVRYHILNVNRSRTLERLRERLEAESQAYDLAV